MTENKLQCYVKSVKKDTGSILTSIKPVIIEFLRRAFPVILVLFGVFSMFTLMVYCEPYLASAAKMFDNLFTALMTQPFITQYNTYMVMMVVIDLIMFYLIHHIMTQQPGDSEDRLPIRQVLYSVGFLFALFLFNAMLVIISWQSPTPERFVGWSFLAGETVINMILVTVGILLLRAYLKCEDKIVPLKSEDTKQRMVD